MNEDERQREKDALAAAIVDASREMRAAETKADPQLTGRALLRWRNAVDAMFPPLPCGCAHGHHPPDEWGLLDPNNRTPVCERGWAIR